MGAPGPWPNGSLQWPGLQRRLTARIGTAMYWAPEVAGHSMFDHGWCHLVSGYSNPIKKKKPSKAIKSYRIYRIRSCFFPFFWRTRTDFSAFCRSQIPPVRPWATINPQTFGAWALCCDLARKGHGFGHWGILVTMVDDVTIT